MNERLLFVGFVIGALLLATVAIVGFLSSDYTDRYIACTGMRQYANGDVSDKPGLPVLPQRIVQCKQMGLWP